MDHSPGFLKLAEDARSRVREISVEEARARLEQAEAGNVVALTFVGDVGEERIGGAGNLTGARIEPSDQIAELAGIPDRTVGRLDRIAPF